MILIRTYWYLCALFFTMLTVESLITVRPDDEKRMSIIMLVLLISAIASAGRAIWLYRKFKTRPDSIIFKSKMVIRTVVGVAITLTLFLLFGVIG